MKSLLVLYAMTLSGLSPNAMALPALSEYKKCWDQTLGHGLFFATGMRKGENGVYLFTGAKARFQKLDSIQQSGIAYEIPKDFLPPLSEAPYRNTEAFYLFYDGRRPNPSYLESDYQFSQYDRSTLQNIYKVKSENLKLFGTYDLVEVNQEMANALSSRILWELSLPSAPKNKQSCLRVVN